MSVPEEFIAGYRAALRDLNGPETIERARVILADPEAAARRAFADPNWLTEVVPVRGADDRTLPGISEALGRSPTTGNVYVLHDPSRDLYKVGWTSGDPTARCRAIANSSGIESLSVVLTITGVTRDYETAVHELLGAARVHGEWFKPCADLDELLATGGLPA